MTDATSFRVSIESDGFDGSEVREGPRAEKGAVFEEPNHKTKRNAPASVVVTNVMVSTLSPNRAMETPVERVTNPPHTMTSETPETSASRAGTSARWRPNAINRPSILAGNCRQSKACPPAACTTRVEDPRWLPNGKIERPRSLAQSKPDRRSDLPQ